MKTTITKAVAVAAVVMSLAGCVGSNAVTGKLMKFNVEVVDNRYARAGVNFLLAPVYALTTAADYIVFNSLEFWTGKNPLTGAPHIFDSKVDTMIDVNDSLDDSLKEAPVAPITYQRQIQSGEMQQIDENTIRMDITYNDGEKAVLMGVRDGDNVSYYLDGALVSETSIQALEQLAAEKV
ncbi:DUF3332 family protein [Vibrio sp. D404a]|uniref:DUF3332 domain-containing protein n=1 Tax=unclassified Vibrio TaxID=2614977 RepID=UPI0025578AA7|nr:MULTISPECIES: DUF3332 domain-containing protein [unclassified Vibrio]MDK9740173.1 DUF3332 family protein [Vibrio sp. D404a]MDK9799107.1 DUF3332 family protein [Vibrio sp. D449a]